MIRYRGHISLCEIDLPGQNAISNGKVLIVGAGGLGSPVALYLAAAGVGHIGIVDPDTVSLSNLQRQIMHGTNDIGEAKVESARRSMLDVNPGIDVTPYREYLTVDNAERLFREYDLIMDCTDNFDTRLLISDTAVSTGKPYIFGGVSRFHGQIFTHVPGTATFSDFFGREAPDETLPCSITGIINTAVGVVGSLQATEAIKYLVGTGDLLTNRLLIFDAITMEFQCIKIAN